MTRRAAIAALALAAFAQARGEWVTEVVTNEYDGVEYLGTDTESSIAYIDTRIETTARTDSSSLEMLLTYTRVTSNRQLHGADNGRFMGCSASSPTWDMGSVSFVLGQYHTLNNTIDSSGRWSFSVDGNLPYRTGQTSATSTLRTCIFKIGGDDYNQYVSYYCRVKSVKFFKNGEFLLYLIPIVHNGEGKMLNLIDNTLYANAGTGAFTYGAVTGKVAGATYITTNRVYRAPAPMRSFDAAHPFNNAAARTRLGGTGSGEDGTTLRPSAHFAIKKNEED